jgi:hypothetical protein
VLVVDDAAAIRRIVAELLEDTDYVVATAGGRNDGIGGGVVSEPCSYAPLDTRHVSRLGQPKELSAAEGPDSVGLVRGAGCDDMPGFLGANGLSSAVTNFRAIRDGRSLRAAARVHLDLLPQPAWRSQPSRMCSAARTCL